MESESSLKLASGAVEGNRVTLVSSGSVFAG